MMRFSSSTSKDWVIWQKLAIEDDPPTERRLDQITFA